MNEGDEPNPFLAMTQLSNLWSTKNKDTSKNKSNAQTIAKKKDKIKEIKQGSPEKK